MFRPNIPCRITSMDQPTDMYGQPTEGKHTDTKCGIIRLEQSSIKTSVRADSSASRGQAIEDTAQSRLLFPANTVIKAKDRVMVAGFTLEVQSIYPRYDIQGRLDHWQVDLDIWASE